MWVLEKDKFIFYSSLGFYFWLLLFLKFVYFGHTKHNNQKNLNWQMYHYFATLSCFDRNSHCSHWVLLNKNKISASTVRIYCTIFNHTLFIIMVSIEFCVLSFIAFLYLFGPVALNLAYVSRTKLPKKKTSYCCYLPHVEK